MWCGTDYSQFHKMSFNGTGEKNGVTYTYCEVLYGHTGKITLGDEQLLDTGDK